MHPIGRHMMRMLSPQSSAYNKWKKIMDHHVLHPQPRSNLRATFRSCSEECCNLLADMLQVDERIRATAAQCFRSRNMVPFLESTNP